MALKETMEKKNDTEQLGDIFYEIQQMWSKSTVDVLKKERQLFILIDFSNDKVIFKYAFKELSFQNEKNIFNLDLADECFEEKILQNIQELVLTLNKNFGSEIRNSSHHFELNYYKQISELFISSLTRKNTFVVIKNKHTCTCCKGLSKEIEFELFPEKAANAA